MIRSVFGHKTKPHIFYEAGRWCADIPNLGIAMAFENFKDLVKYFKSQS